MFSWLVRDGASPADNSRGGTRCRSRGIKGIREQLDSTQRAQQELGLSLAS